MLCYQLVICPIFSKLILQFFWREERSTENFQNSNFRNFTFFQKINVRFAIEKSPRKNEKNSPARNKVDKNKIMNTRIIEIKFKKVELLHAFRGFCRSD